MIKNIKLFINNNPKSIKEAKIVKSKLINNGFKVVDSDEFDLAIAIGGDGSFLRMIHQNNFDNNIYYVGINTGHLGFLQDIKPSEIDKFIKELKENEYVVDNIGIQETSIIHSNDISKFYTLNEIVVRNQNLDSLNAEILIDGDFLEKYKGDGIMVVTSIGSTAYNLSYGGSIVYPTFSTLQVTSMAPINSKVYRSLINSLIIPEKKVVQIKPQNPNIILTVDGENNIFNDASSIDSIIGDKKIKVLRFKHYSFSKKINEKFLS